MNIGSVGILGAGTMGAQIALHFANAGVPSLLLDVTRDAARQGLERARKLKPDPQFTPDTWRLVRTGSFDEDLVPAGGRGLGHGSDRRAARGEARPAGARRATLRAARGAEHQHLGHPGRRHQRRLAAGAAPALAGHALLQSAPLPAPARDHPDARHRPGPRRRRGRLRRPRARQGRGRGQGHAQLHRQPPGPARRGGDAARRRVGQRHHRRGRRHHRQPPGPARVSHLPHRRHRRPRRARARHAQSRGTLAPRRRPGLVCALAAAAAPDRRRGPRRESGPRLLRAAQGRGRGVGRLHARSHDLRIREAAPAGVRLDRSGRGHPRHRHARARAVPGPGPRRRVPARHAGADAALRGPGRARDRPFDRRRRPGHALGLRLGSRAFRTARRHRPARGHGGSRGARHHRGAAARGRSAGRRPQPPARRRAAAGRSRPARAHRSGGPLDGGQAQPRRQPRRPRRRRAVRAVPLEDEQHRRRHHRHAPGRRDRGRDQLPGAGRRQRGRRTSRPAPT